MNLNLPRINYFQKKSFARYCRDAYTSPGEKIENATTQFIDGILETDLFLWPLYKMEHAKDNVESYFSPFQMFIVAMLRGNVVTEDGSFGDPENVIHNLTPNTKFIRWGSRTSYNLDAQKINRQRKSSMPNILNVSETYHRFILLLHSIGPNTDYGSYTERTTLRFTQAPNINYAFKRLEEKPNLINKYGLAEEDLVLLRYVLGDFAFSIDPMFIWFKYMEKHPRGKKDLLTGDALLAQELYDIAELLGETQKTLTGKQPDELLKAVYGKGIFVPYMAPITAKYLHGNDTDNLQKVTEDFKMWRNESDNEKFVPEGFNEKLDTLVKELGGYVERYGYRSYKSNRVILGPYNEKTAYRDLCKKAKSHIDSFREHLKRSNRKVTEEEMASEISFAIERALDDLNRRFWDVFNEVGNEIDREVSKIEHEDELAKIHDASSLLKKGEIQEHLKNVRNLRDSFNSEILYATGYIVCNRCRKNRVLPRF